VTIQVVGGFGMSKEDVSASSPSRGAPLGLETARNVARRLGCSVRTIERWSGAGILPPPIQINGRNYYPAGVMPKVDKSPCRLPPIAARALPKAVTEGSGGENRATLTGADRAPKADTAPRRRWSRRSPQEVST